MEKKKKSAGCLENRRNNKTLRDTYEDNDKRYYSKNIFFSEYILSSLYCYNKLLQGILDTASNTYSCFFPTPFCNLYHKNLQRRSLGAAESKEEVING